MLRPYMSNVVRASAGIRDGSFDSLHPANQWHSCWIIEMVR